MSGEIEEINLNDTPAAEENAGSLLDQLDALKTGLFGYSKEATCEFMQKLVTKLETQKKKENGVLLRRNETLQSDKAKLAKQLAEMKAKYDALEAERQRDKEQQTLLQSKYDELVEKLSTISENAIAREKELSGYHLREQQMKDREASLQKMEQEKAEELEKIKAEFLSKLGKERQAVLETTKTEADEVFKKAEQLKKELRSFRQKIEPLLDFEPAGNSQVVQMRTQDQASNLRKANDRT